MIVLFISIIYVKSGKRREVGSGKGGKGGLKKTKKKRRGGD
jgi:hypothetical protein